MRLITVFAIFTCAMLVTSFDLNIFKKEKVEEKSTVQKIKDKVSNVFKPEPPKEEEPSFVQRMAAKVTDVFKSQKDKEDEESSRKKFSDLWETLTRAKKEKAKPEDESSKKSWAEAFKFKSVWETLKHIKKAKDVNDEVKSKKWYEFLKISNLWKSKNETKQTSKGNTENEEERSWYEAFKFGNTWDKVRGSINSGARKMFKRDYITEEKIMAAIEKEKREGIESMMNETKDIEVEEYEFPKAIKTIDTNNASLKNCTHYLKPMVPGLMKFGLNSAIGRVPNALSHLFDVMKYIPELSKNCLGKEVKIVGHEPDVSMCKKDVVELSKVVSEFAKHPFQIVGEYRRLKHMIDLVPETLGYCTTAFV
eukprot:CAMPEP_0176432640 /NCGR_PEP_ID=MMETSP0127-20121128/15509_1 /TAXON_ID=938130 /ORGANISM="Platyophrya macrostoma, Strain WH" /LENGTH=364 /DNA_ID=CAMNT_0017814839 /DNA_START=44 /DNA_END=1138 /DNA_ORIENTATION=-